MWVRRIAGLAWIAAYVATIVLLLDLWSRLGGLVDERLRWWARLGLLGSPVLGYYAGLHAREMAGWGGGRSHAALLRWFCLPPAAFAAAAGAWWTLHGAHDETRALLGAWFAYQAGFDAAIAAWPLACGRPWRFLREIPPEQLPDPEDLARGAGDRPFADRVERDPP